MKAKKKVTAKYAEKKFLDACENLREQKDLGFTSCIENRIEKTKYLLLVKGKEYVRNNDRFHNFNRVAEMDRITPTRALHGMLAKHLSNYLDLIDDVDRGIMPSLAAIEERFGDIIVYMMLQEALIKQTIRTK